MKYNALLIVTFYIVSLSSCGTEETPLPLYEIIPTSHSKLSFVNNLRESPTQNVLNYEYFYNGAGVAVADFNNDEYPDIFFVSNLEANNLYINQKNLTFLNIGGLSKQNTSSGFSTGVSIVDINNDNLLDIYICKSGRFKNPLLRKNELYVNQGINENGIPLFTEQAEKYGLDIAAYSTQATFFDYDKDGDLDMLLINHGIDTYDAREVSSLKNQSNKYIGEQLYHNHDGNFTEVTKEAGFISNSLGFGLGIAVSDLNNDNFPDIYVSNDYSGKDHLYINQQDGTFKELINELTNQISFYAMGNDVADINNDGWMDIVNLDMVAQENYGVKTSMSAMNTSQFSELVQQDQHYQYMYNSLLLNNGAASDADLPYFSNIGQLAGISSTDWSWAPLLFDMDNDGWQDLFISNGIKRNIRNNDALKKVNPLRQNLLQTKDENKKSKIIQQILQLFPYHPKPNYFFKNNGNLTFDNITGDLQLDSLYTMSSGAAYADFDLDGDLDIIVTNADRPALLLKNNTNLNHDRHSLQIRLEGPSNNRFGIGTKVTVTDDQGIQTKELYTSRGYKSSVEPMLHFGLGNHTLAKEIKVLWPDGLVQVLNNIESGKLILRHSDAIKEGLHRETPSTILSIKSSGTKEIKHVENLFDDFAREGLLPHKMSNMGPYSAVADVNHDGIDDLFIGGAAGHAAELLLGKKGGGYMDGSKTLWLQEKQYEDVAGTFVDFEMDGDMDLVVGSGSNEDSFPGSSYALRFYVNDGFGAFTKLGASIPDINISAGAVLAVDIDNDGDKDLFVGGRQLPGQYPSPCDSHLLLNTSERGQVSFTEVTKTFAPFLEHYGMVTDAICEDVNNDGLEDIITVGEWMSPKLLLNRATSFADASDESGLADQIGWWNTISSADFDNDGDKDLIVGNLGLNYKYKATKDKPFVIYGNDFDNNGTSDILLSFYEDESLVPLRGRQCSSEQMPFIKDKFKTYDAFAKATVNDIFTVKQLDKAAHYQATSFSHSYYENLGNGSYRAKDLPIESQISSINTFHVDDFDKDGFLDFLCAGNLYESEVETPRNDASFGQLFLGKGNGTFSAMPYTESGFRTKGEVRDILKLSTKENSQFLVIKNNAIADWYEFNL